MLLGKVCGTIHSTINHPFYDNKKLLLVDRLKKDGTSSGKYVIAIDTVDAGAGETVLVIDEGNSARQIVNDSSAPLRSIIIGIVDQISFLDA
jgi:ethanolamine utilization protein EutN